MIMQNFPNIPIDDSQDIYGDYDNPCFPAGKTPRYMYVSFSSIQPGTLYDPVTYSYSIPSGTWKLEQFDENIWYLERGNYEIYAIVDTVGIIVIFSFYVDEVWIDVFISYHEDWLYYSDNNWFDVPTDNHFYEGQMSIAWFPPEEPNPIGDIALAVGVERSAKTFYQGIAQTDTHATYRLASRIHDCNLKIKIDKSA